MAKFNAITEQLKGRDCKVLLGGLGCAYCGDAHYGDAYYGDAYYGDAYYGDAYYGYTDDVPMFHPHSSMNE